MHLSSLILVLALASLCRPVISKRSQCGVLPQTTNKTPCVVSARLPRHKCVDLRANTTASTPRKNSGAPGWKCSWSLTQQTQLHEHTPHPASSTVSFLDCVLRSCFSSVSNHSSVFWRGSQSEKRTAFLLLTPRSVHVHLFLSASQHRFAYKPQSAVVLLPIKHDCLVIASCCPASRATERESTLSGTSVSANGTAMTAAASLRKTKGADAAASQGRAGQQPRGVKRDQADSPGELPATEETTSPISSVSRGVSGSGKPVVSKRIKTEPDTQTTSATLDTKADGTADAKHSSVKKPAMKSEAHEGNHNGTEGEMKQKVNAKGAKVKGETGDEADDTQEGEAKNGGKAPKRSAGKKQSTAGNLPTEVDEVFLRHRAVAEKSRKFLGAHISAAGGVQNAPVNCLAIGGQAFAFFLKNQRRWDSPPISDESADGFKAEVAKLKLDGPEHILPHGSYLINLANPDAAKRKVSYNAFLDDLQRCEQIGVHRYVFHPGSTVGQCTKEESIRHIAECLNKAIAATKSVTILLENMAGQKNVLCSEFEDLRDIIALVDRKDRIGVCLDTCHLYSAGHDIKTEEKFEAVMKKFDSIVGMKYLKAMHINDSKAPLGSGLDRHEHLGKGTLGMAPFKFIMQHPTWFKDMPLVLETPDVDNSGPAMWRKETEMMYKFIEE
ncbi:endonuclease IV APN [Toxoplasma gondii VAND]|uniref:Endonuclease IV APN n=4 Tax=Toxoplasma gondii TaxID=5811 RepID=B9QDU2_TOXGV|nr:endonuclease IV APN [Toxoplasma gondii VEG]KFG28887.1 endonuclease IV APN [Toxoplasma gondii p89]KFH08803.1 endonuclease IV APN [Toxoplasma gondii VAND]CEL75874.1 TPA: endonuclease V, putative [Toxoplasma gondii VEG]